MHFAKGYLDANVKRDETEGAQGVVRVGEVSWKLWLKTLEGGLKVLGENGKIILKWIL